MPSSGILCLGGIVPYLKTEGSVPSLSSSQVNTWWNSLPDATLHAAFKNTCKIIYKVVPQGLDGGN